MPRIISFLPSATEIAYTIGAGAELVGRSHECDFPPEVTALPVVSKPALPIGEMTQNEIDIAVASHLASGRSLYEVDEVLLREPHSDVRIGLLQHPENGGERFSEFRTGLDHVEFEVESPAALDAWRRRLDSLGIAWSGARAHIVTFRDPDNIQLEFYCAAMASGG